MAKYEMQRNNPTRLILMIVAAIAAVGIITITAFVLVDNRAEESLSAQTFINSIVGREPLEIGVDATPVLTAEKCFDHTGALVAYAITAYGEGFAGRVTVKSYFDPDGKTLIGIQVTDQIESKHYGSLSSQNYGADVADSTYIQRFEHVTMPVWLYDGTVSEEAVKDMEGTRVDALSGATISSQAVVSAVNTAYTYFMESVM